MTKYMVRTWLVVTSVENINASSVINSLIKNPKIYSIFMPRKFYHHYYFLCNNFMNHMKQTFNRARKDLISPETMGRVHFYPAAPLRPLFFGAKFIAGQNFRFPGRGERIRTSDSCVPNAVLYQAELHPELKLP
jgi:hypothetical protein